MAELEGRHRKILRAARASSHGTASPDRREPALFACADYHRPTTDGGWLTFEVRDADAKGLVLQACLPSFSGCESPGVIRLE